MRVLVPGHFRADLQARCAGMGVELVPYDARGRPQADSAGAEVLFRWWLASEEGDNLLEHHPLRWIHSGSAGIDHILTPAFRARAPLLTTAAGVHAPSIAEWVVAAILSITKDLPAMAVQQRERRFDKVQRDELTGRTVVFLGTGRIATEIARRLAPFGVRMRGVRWSAAPHAIIPEVLPPERLADACRDAAWLIIAAPLTPETRGAVGADVLRALPSFARIVNVSRGELIDEPALIDALRERTISGAVLDVFGEEPLPPDHPFWAMESVMVLPHTTWRSPEVRERQIALFTENLGRFLEGRDLINLVDVARGY